MQPLVSIVIPCYRGAQYLPKAIESCLAQTYRNIEIIVVDDKSPDNCAEIAEGYARKDSRIRVIRHERNTGVAGGFNTGFHAAKGEIMTRLAQDDLFEPDAVAVLLNFLQENPEVAFVYGHMRLIDGKGDLIEIKES